MQDVSTLNFEVILWLCWQEFGPLEELWICRKWSCTCEVQWPHCCAKYKGAKFNFCTKYRNFWDRDGVFDLEAEDAWDVRNEGPGNVGGIADEGVKDRGQRRNHDVCVMCMPLSPPRVIKVRLVTFVTLCVQTFPLTVTPTSSDTFWHVPNDWFATELPLLTASGCSDTLPLSQGCHSKRGDL